VIFIKKILTEIKERRLRNEITQKKLASHSVSKFLNMIEVLASQDCIVTSQIKIREFDKCKKIKMENDKDEYSK